MRERHQRPQPDRREGEGRDGAGQQGKEKRHRTLHCGRSARSGGEHSRNDRALWPAAVPSCLPGRRPGGGAALLRRVARLPGGPERRPLGRFRPPRPPDRRASRAGSGAAPGRPIRSMATTCRCRISGWFCRWTSGARLPSGWSGAGTEFVIPPTVRFEGQPGEQATMFLLDPAGNALEFKAMADPAKLFATG